LGDDGLSTPRRRFTLDVSRTAHATLVTLAGELDVVCADTFRRHFADAADDESEHVVIDLRDLTFIDSTGLALLLRVNEMARDAGFRLWMVSTPEDPAQKIFRLTGTDAILPIVDELPGFAAEASPRASGSGAAASPGPRPLPS
jgi:anti-sigma B factor antagonist